jgi:hypothetical protein
MEPISAALAAAAAFTLNGMASKAVEDAYKALKGLLAGKLSSLATFRRKNPRLARPSAWLGNRKNCTGEQV